MSPQEAYFLGVYAVVDLILSKDPPKAAGQTSSCTLSEMWYSELFAYSPQATSMFASELLHLVQSVCGRKLIAKYLLLVKSSGGW